MNLLKLLITKPTENLIIPRRTKTKKKMTKEDTKRAIRTIKMIKISENLR